MSEQIIAREMHQGVWEWCLYSADGAAKNDVFHSGDGAALAGFLPSVTTPVTIVMRGQQVVATKVELDAKQKKHAAKLIPFELEDELSSNVDAVHFAYGQFTEKFVPVLYAEKDTCAAPLDDLTGEGCDVRAALPDYLMLRRAEGGITVLLEGGLISARISDDWGFTIELELAPMLFERLTQHSALKDGPPTNILLVAESLQECDTLKTLLPSDWLQDDTINIDVVEGGFWDSLDIASSNASALNLRRGRFARQLPVRRWWSHWKLPSIFIATAFVVAMLVQYMAYLSAKSEEQSIREDINAVYLQAVPNGRLGDPERVLESRLKSTSKTSNEPTNFMFLLSKVTDVIASDANTSLSSYSYSGEQRALQLTLEFASLGALSDFRAALQKRGVASDSPRTTSVGDRYQARMKIREAN